jgi:hypothetical protein
MHFRFSVMPVGSSLALKFSKMYLLLNGSTEVRVDWSHTYNISEFNNAYFSGARIFTVPTDCTTVQFILNRTLDAPIHFKDPTSTQNAVTCITFEKIDDV